MTETRHEKCRRIRLILQELEDQPRELKDIISLFPEVHKRTIQYYLQELQEMGIIEFDRRKSHYCKAGIVKKVYSHIEYEIALEHSRLLLFTHDERYQGFNQTSPDKWLDILLNPERYVNSEELRCLMQHLKQGYNKEFWIPLQKYQKMKASKAHRRLKNKLFELEKDLLKTFLGIMMDVEHGAPLRASCDRCPTEKIQISD